MLSEYWLRNFKAFSEPQKIKLSPITLIYGPNSVGKSSIIQSLMLLKQTIEESRESSLSLLSVGSLVDLGNYREFIHRHDAERKLSVRFQIEVDPKELQLPETMSNESETIKKVYGFLYDMILDFPYLSIEFFWEIDSENYSVKVDKILFWVGKEEIPVITYRLSNGKELKVESIHSDHQFWKNWWAEYSARLKVRFLNQVNSTLSSLSINRIDKRNQSDIDSFLKEEVNKLKRKLVKAQSARRELEKTSEKIESQLSRASEELKILKSKQNNEIKELTQDKQEAESRLNELSIDTEVEDASEATQLFSAAENHLRECNKKIEDLENRHEKEEEPLKEGISELERENNKNETEISGIDKNIDELDEVLETLEWLRCLCMRTRNYTIDRAVEDYQKVASTIDIQLDNFLITDASAQGESLAIDDSNSLNPSSQESFERSFLHEVYEGTSCFDFVLQNSLFVCDSLREILYHCAYVGPARENSERFYMFSESSNKGISKTGKGFSDALFKDSELLRRVNETLENFNIGYRLKVASFRDEDTKEKSNMYAIQLVDNCLGVTVSPLDVGYGISQILPIVVQSILDENRTVVIEQPEVHIHPRLQTELSSLLAYSYKKLGNQFIVETHSEHMILRIQKLIRNRELSHKEVSVLYVDRNEQGTKVLPLRLDSEGDFIDSWPDGFFEEDFDEMF